MVSFIDTHAHLDGPEFIEDRTEVVQRAKEAGADKVFVPAIDLPSVDTVMDFCRQFPDFAYPMIGLHPEEVKADWENVLSQMRRRVDDPAVIAIGEVGLDFYWSREYEKEQLAAFEQQVRWSVETRLPLMIHCRKAQNELVAILRRYRKELPGGVFHCFTGNAHEAEELLDFEGFALGIGGVLTFRKSHLPEVLPAAVPLSRLVLETDAPYMAPVPRRGERNESAFIPYVMNRLAEAYGVGIEEIARQTSENVYQIFGALS